MPRLACAAVLAVLASWAPAQETAKPDWTPVFKNLQPRLIGPTTMSGRFQDLAVYEKEPRIFYAASASGGLWKTINAGTTFEPVFDRENTVSMGAVAVSQRNPDLVWVGTGEASSRNSVAWGDGVYKSTDGGKTWTNMGLKETHHISKIIIDPNNDDVVYVGALGRLWGKNEERGVYKTTDGGKTWERVLYVDDSTGVADMQMDPSDSRTLLVGMWTRMRYPWNFVSGGPGSGLHKTTDGGRTWRRITNGLPSTTIGRIGLSIMRSKPNIVVATVENRPDGGTYRSTDKGESWTKMNNLNPRPFYFSNPLQDPLDENRVYLLGVNVHVSDDKGATFRTMRVNLHPDYHAGWIDPTDSNHMIFGNDGGVGLTRDRGEKWVHFQNLPVAQYYAVAVDMRKPYWIYGGLQDNSNWGIPSNSRRGGVAFYDASYFSAGDGFHMQVDPTDYQWVYGESQGGALNRYNQVTGVQRGIRPTANNTTPRPEEGERWRFNWSSPFILSPHNPKTIYFGGNRLFKSVNQGDSWTVISPDMTTNNPAKQRPGEGSVTPENTGAERHCTIVTLAESELRQGLLWIGTDDGLVHYSPDDGKTWREVTQNIPDLPANTWCSRITPSRFKLERVYATFDGHRTNDFKPYVYVSDDLGQTWTKLNNNLPDYDCWYVIKEGLKNENLLFGGSEMSLWISLDRGQNWYRFRNNFPTVAVHDLVIHPRDGDLVIGTHGRAIWTLDVNGLDQMTSLDAEVAIFQPQPVYNIGFITGGGFGGNDSWLTVPNTQPGTLIQYWLKDDVADDVRIAITDIAGRSVADLQGAKTAGLNTVRWNARAQGRVVAAGTYRVTLKIGEKEYSTTVLVEDAFKD